MKVALCLLLVGCGRIAFDDVPSDGTTGASVCPATLAVGHDEDRDGVDDGCDGCPHIADGAQPDADGDGVDDACDPNPSTPGDRIVFFDSFAAGLDASWAADVTYGSPVDDAVTVDSLAAPAYLKRFTPPANDTYTLGAYVVSESASGHQFTIQGNTSGPSDYYCEILAGQTSAKVAMTYTLDSVSFMVNDPQSLVAPVRGGDVSLTMNKVGDTVTCSTSWPPAPRSVGVNPGIAAETVDLFINGSVIELHYFIDIASP